MSNSNKRDANFVPVLSGEGDNSLTLPWSLDSVTGRVLIEIHPITDAGASTPVNRALKDANFRNTITGLSDDGHKQPLSAAIDHRNGFLYVDLILG